MPRGRTFKTSSVVTRLRKLSKHSLISYECRARVSWPFLRNWFAAISNVGAVSIDDCQHIAADTVRPVDVLNHRPSQIGIHTFDIREARSCVDGFAPFKTACGAKGAVRGDHTFPGHDFADYKLGWRRDIVLSGSQSRAGEISRNLDTHPARCVLQQATCQNAPCLLVRPCINMIFLSAAWRAARQGQSEPLIASAACTSAPLKPVITTMTVCTAWRAFLNRIDIGNCLGCETLSFSQSQFAARLDDCWHLRYQSCQ